jgi:hypothetical protein
MGLQVGDTLLTEATVYTIDTVYEYANLYTIYFYDLSFYEPDLQYDTLYLKKAQLPYTYRGQVIDAFGDYEFMLMNEAGCVEQVMLHVVRHIPASVDDALIYDRPRIVMHDGIIYILRGTEVFTILGEKVE